MKALASFIMRGRTQATLVAVVGAVLSLVIPPLSHLSGATIGLVTLRNGAKEGLFIMVALGIVVALIGSMSSLDGGLVQAYVIGMVLLSVPVLIAAMVLRVTRSLGQALTVIAVMAALLVLLANMLLGDAAAWWRALLDTVMAPALNEAQLSTQEASEMLDGMARMMTGLVAAVLLYSTMINLSLARWFQGMLYNPGGFQQEFHALFLDKRVAIAAALVGVAGMVFAGQGGISQDLMILVVALFSIHGLALVHGVIGITGMGRGWLIALYVGLLIVPPHIAMMLAMVGYIDCWVDFRGRLRKKSEGIDQQNRDNPPRQDELDELDDDTSRDDRSDDDRSDDERR
ncbi:MAG TPA: hypothetical protein ENJ13_01905 [Chromatiales bacterium]|nr:hypothetical protein [Chromatiales bacterium]